jgi:hypothetical protein
LKWRLFVKFTNQSCSTMSSSSWLMEYFLGSFSLILTK